MANIGMILRLGPLYWIGHFCMSPLDCISEKTLPKFIAHTNLPEF